MSIASEIEAAYARGDWASAAALMEQDAQHSRAAQVYQQLLLFDAAARAHQAAGNWVDALLCAARSRQPAVENNLLEQACRTAPTSALTQAAQGLLQQQRPDLAARLFDAAGEVELAAAAHESAGDFQTAARRHLAAGHHRQAGMLLERHLEQNPQDPAAMLQLGNVLARFGRHDQAAILFRGASAAPAHQETALRRLASSFWAQGFHHAAEKVLDDLARVAPDAPRDVLGLAALQRVDQDNPPPQGARVDHRHVLLAPLGSTSLGDTYLAHDAFTDRRGWLTVFRPSVVRSPALARFAALAHAAHHLQLPGLLPLWEFNLEQGYMVTAVPHGQPLTRWFREGGVLPVDRVVRVAAETLLALHRRGLVHGQLNPSTVLISPGGDVQLADAGAGALMALRETESLGLESAWATLAPELVGGSAPTAATDQFALGALAHRLVLGVWPHHPPGHATGLDGGVVSTLARALHPIPENRFANVQDFLHALPRLPNATFTAPPLASPVPEPGPRFRDVGTPVDAGHVSWQRGWDNILQRPLWFVRGAPGSLAALRVVAPLYAGVQRVWDLAADGSWAHLEDVQDPPDTPGNWAAVARALDALHAQALSLGPQRALRLPLEGPARLQFSGLPLPVAGGPLEQQEDVAWLLKVVARHTHTHGPALPTQLPALARHLDAQAPHLALVHARPTDTAPRDPALAEHDLAALYLALGLER